MRELKNKITCLVGESGSGKTTLYDLLRNKGYKVIDSYTTRPPRKANELGHTFVTKEEFDAIRPDLAAYTVFDGYEYGTTFEQLENSQFYIIDPAGVEYFSKKIGRENFIVVYIWCSIVIRYERLMKDRGMSDAMQRINHDDAAFKSFIENKDWDHIINNDYPELLLSNVQSLIDISKAEV